MEPEKPISSEQYEGASPATIALGKAKIFGWIGSLTGIGVGLLTSGYFSESIQKYLPRAKELLTKLSIPITEKNAIRAAGGVAGYFIGHYVGAAFGFARHIGPAKRGEQQFEQIKAERDDAREKLAALEAEKQATPATEVHAHPAKKFTDHVPSREAEGSHAEAALHENDSTSLLPPR